MADRSAGNSSASWLKEIFLFALMLLVAFFFFSVVRNNPFWHTSDYLYLLEALRIEQNWHNLFGVETLSAFQPLLNLIFYFEFRMFGDNPAGYYFFNILIA